MYYSPNQIIRGFFLKQNIHFRLCFYKRNFFRNVLAECTFKDLEQRVKHSFEGWADLKKREERMLSHI
jgi:hypothetical protein